MPGVGGIAEFRERLQAVRVLIPEKEGQKLFTW